MTSELLEKYFYKKTVQESTQRIVPFEFSTCQVSISCKGVLGESWMHGLNYATDGKPLDICVGSGCTPFNMIIDWCLFRMKVGEVCKLLLRANADTFHDVSNAERSEYLRYLSSDSPSLDTPCPDNVIPVLVTLVDVTEQAKEVFTLTPKQKLDIAKEFKAKGADLFKEHLTFSFILFSRALKYAICIDDFADPDIADDVSLLKTQCYLNLGACQLQCGAYDLVLQNCTKALDLDPSSVKGLYRRAQAHAKTADYESAEIDLEKALGLEPSNRQLQALMKDIKQKRHKQDSTLMKAMSKMFA